MNTATVDEGAITFNESHSLLLRIWHWTTLLVLTSTLVTVLLGSTMFRTRNTIELVQEQLQEKGVVVTKDQARAVAHEYSDLLWMTHKYIGYGLCFLLLTRFFIELVQPKEEKLSQRIRRVLSFNVTSAGEKGDKRLYLVVKRRYVVFYAWFLTMGITGLGLAYEHAPYLEDIQDPIKAVHKFTQYIIYSFITLHLVGVIASDAGKY